MGIYQKTKNILGKITLIIMTAIFPFVIFVHTNKNLILCNVFIIISSLEYYLQLQMNLCITGALLRIFYYQG